MAGFQLINDADAAYAAMARLFSADLVPIEKAFEGYGVGTGGQIVAGTNAGTVKCNSGTDVFVGTTITYAATDNVACAANADGTNPRWQLIEVDSSGVVQSNLGTAAANPVPPAPTAGRIVHAAVYIPAGATTVDVLLSTANGKAKIIDKRIFCPATFGGVSSGNVTPVPGAFEATGMLTTQHFGTGRVKIGDDPTTPRVLFGDADDVNLYRSGADALATDDAFNAGGVLSQAGVAALLVGDVVIDRQVFTASGTWTKPTNAVLSWGRVIGGGGGGGSGRRGAAGTDRFGGGGGGTGGVVEFILRAADMGATETVTIGAGGAGGAARTTDSTNGNAGGTGSASSFGAHATGGASGGVAFAALGGTATAGQGGDGSVTTDRSASFDNLLGLYAMTAFGGSSSVAATAGAGATGQTGFTAGGGGAGGGLSAANVARAGGAGGKSGDGAAGGPGGAATGGTGQDGSVPTKDGQFGPGGGGGGAGTGVGGSGGASFSGAGGGGGAASVNGNNSGAGGVGGGGYCVVYTLRAR